MLAKLSALGISAAMECIHGVFEVAPRLRARSIGASREAADIVVLRRGRLILLAHGQT